MPPLNISKTVRDVVDTLANHPEGMTTRQLYDKYKGTLADAGLIDEKEAIDKVSKRISALGEQGVITYAQAKDGSRIYFHAEALAKKAAPPEAAPAIIEEASAELEAERPEPVGVSSEPAASYLGEGAIMYSLPTGGALSPKLNVAIGDALQCAGKSIAAAVAEAIAAAQKSAPPGYCKTWRIQLSNIAENIKPLRPDYAETLEIVADFLEKAFPEPVAEPTEQNCPF